MPARKKLDPHRMFIVAISSVVLTAFAPATLANPGAGQSLPPTSGPQIDPAQSYREGLEALQEDDCKTAEKRFGEVLRASRKMPEANYYMGLAKVCRDKDKSSVRYFERAIKERPDFIEAREQLALVFIRLEQPENASEQLAALKQIQADCETSGCGEAAAARVASAIEKVEAAMGGGEVSAAPDERQFAGLFFAPREAGVDHYQDAAKLINQDRYHEAIEGLYQAQAIVGPHPDILNYLGFAHRKLGRFDEAKAYYAAALKLAPDHLGANEYLGELYLELGQIDKAKQQLARLDQLCAFGCAEREDLARLIEIKQSVRRAEH